MTANPLAQPGAVIRSRATGREYKVSEHPGGLGWRTFTRCDDGTDIMALATDLTNGSYDLVQEGPDARNLPLGPACGFEVKTNPLLPENVIVVRTPTMQGIMAGLVREYRQAAGREHLLHEDEPSPIPAEVLQAAQMQSYPSDREQIAGALGLPRDATTEQMAARIHLLVFTKNSLTQKINAMTELAHEIVKKGSRP